MIEPMKKNEVLQMKNDEEQKGVLALAQDEADTKLADLAKEGDMDAIKLLSERMQEREELKLRKELFGV